MKEKCCVLIIFCSVICLDHVVKSKKESSDEDSSLGANLISSLKNDANLDLSVDEEYEDLRAELLAYHTALSKLVSNSRRSMISTPCWQLGGICINFNLCTGFNYLTQIPGCKDTHRVCCFVWNRYEVKDMRDKGINNLALPWKKQVDFGGRGILDVNTTKKRRRHHRNSSKPELTRMFVIRAK